MNTKPHNLSLGIKSNKQNSRINSPNSSIFEKESNKEEEEEDEKTQHVHLQLPEIPSAHHSKHSSQQLTTERSDLSSGAVMPPFTNMQLKTKIQGDIEKAVEKVSIKPKKRPLSCVVKVDMCRIPNGHPDELNSATIRQEIERLIEKDEMYETTNGDDLDEDLIEENDQEDSDDIDEEDEDECVESRPLTPESKKPLEGISGCKKPILPGKTPGMNSTAYRGAFT